MNLRKKVLVGVALTAGLLLLATGGWVAATLLLRDPAPSLLWTEADLPALAPEADNGWHTLQKKSLPRPSVPSTVVRLCDPAAHTTALDGWRAARTHRSDIVSAVSDPSNAAWIAALGEAYRKPHFQDACPLDFEKDCRWIDGLHAHQLVELSVLDSAMEGNFELAFPGVRLLSQGDLSFVVSTRTLLSQMVAFVLLRRTLTLLDVLMAGHDDELANHRPVAAPVPVLQEIRKQWVSLDPASLGMQRALVGEYTMMVKMVDLVEQSPSEYGVSPLGGLLFDRADTLRTINDDYGLLKTFLEVPGTPLPELREPTGPFWWLRNPIGKQLLQVAPVLAPTFERGKNEGKELLTLRDDVLKRLDAFLQAPAPAPPPEP